MDNSLSTTTEEFILYRPEEISDSSWEALCEALELYAEEWDGYDSEEED